MKYTANNIQVWWRMHCARHALLFPLLFLLGMATNHTGRTIAQYSSISHSAYIMLDIAGFWWGMDSLNPTNQMTWTYAVALQKPRPWWHKTLVWNIYDNMPVTDYPYRPNFDHHFPPTLEEFEFND